MTEGQEARAAFREKSAEIAVAELFFLLGAIVVFDSVRLGARWAEDGPQAGYFPFYIGVILCLSSAVNFALAFASKREGIFVEWEKLKLVLAVLVPSAIYVATIS